MKILVGISGSIGVVGIHSYLVSMLLEKEVEEVNAVMTPTAARFLSPRSLEAFLGRTVHVDPWTDPGTMFAPPELVKGIDLYLVAPASATTLSRCAAGAAETLVANCYLCHTGPVAFAPSMSPEMREHPAVRHNLDRLKEFGACILPQGEGFSVAARKMQKSSMCSYAQMWPQLKALVQLSKEGAKSRK
jgi:phosphopantothenoylcysteine decarboxylase/phosphopantothenate--cysteine ligase